MKVTTTAIQTFMKENKDIYPYSAIPQTRRGYYPKWLLTMSRNKQGLIWRQEGYYVIKAGCLNRENLQNLILDGDGIPLPADFGEVVDTIETWGANHWSCWLQKTLHLMHEYLREDNMYGGAAPSKMRLFHDCILLCVQRKTEHNFLRNSAEYDMVLNNWNTYFWVRCRETYSFHDLTFGSLTCVAEMIKSIHSRNSIPTWPTVRVARFPSAHVVPESPVSTSSSAEESTQE